MTKRERLFATANLESTDRIPTLGGWIAWAPHLQELVGIGESEFWQAPRKWTMEAYRRLGCDGLIDLHVPPSQNEYRFQDDQTWRDSLDESHRRYSDVEAAIEHI